MSGEALVLPGHLRPSGLRHVFHEAAQINLLHAQGRLAQTQAAHLEQIIEEPTEPHELPVEDDARALPQRVIWRAPNQFECRERGGKRLALRVRRERAPRRIGDRAADPRRERQTWPDTRPGQLVRRR
jgi:hypothetical protein